MTSILKKQLTIWLGVSLCGGALLWNVGASRAQDNDDPFSRLFAGEAQRPRQKLTLDQAAKNFTEGLDSPQLNGSALNPLQFFESISLKSRRELDVKLLPLWAAMSTQWKQPNKTIEVQSEGNKTATVIVKTNPAPPARPLVLIEENGSWGVDLVETYAKWNGLEGVAKAEAIYKLTGAVLEGLPLSENITRGTCQSNLKQIALGIAQYSQDYDEVFPPARKWIDVLQPYVRSEAIFNCPSLPKDQRFGYAYNSKLSQKDLNLFENSSQTTSLYETSILKRNAYGVGENRAFRHQNGANYAFADGHVKWFPRTATPSFNLKP